MISYENYVTYDARLASFTNPKKRAASVNGRVGKIMRWPHAELRPEDMAAAGMFFDPATTNPDHTICFTCGKGLDGWEPGDNPFAEHLKHSRTCGWAILKAVELGIDGYHELDPCDPGLVTARKGSFGDLWPHEGKKGWKCKVRQLVESGWVYTPTEESEDMATCLYCSLALDGWEPGDKPVQEHESRSAKCPFILAMKQHKKTRGKGSSMANSSIISIHSNNTFTGDQPSMDVTSTVDDSIMTTASIVSKKAPRAKKTTSRSRKTKTEPETEPETEPKPKPKPEPEPIVDEPPAPDPEPVEPEPEPAPPTKGKRAAKGKKRPSEAMEDSLMTDLQPATKKNTRSRKGSNASVASIDNSVLPEVQKGRKGRVSSRSSRGESSNTSFMSAVSSTQVLEDQVLDDDEIDKQLEADLERFTDEEDISADSDSERRSRSCVGSQSGSIMDDSRAMSLKVIRSKLISPEVVSPNRFQPWSSFAMFDPRAAIVHEDEVEDELEEMEIEAQLSHVAEQFPAPGTSPVRGTFKEATSQPERQPSSELQPERELVKELVVSKKGRKAAGMRKVSKTRAKVGKIGGDEEDELADSVNVSTTIVKGGPNTSTISAEGKKGKGKAKVVREEESIKLAEAKESSDLSDPPEEVEEQATIRAPNNKKKEAKEAPVPSPASKETEALTLKKSRPTKVSAVPPPIVPSEAMAPPPKKTTKKVPESQPWPRLRPRPQPQPEEQEEEQFQEAKERQNEPVHLVHRSATPVRSQTPPVRSQTPSGIPRPERAASPLGRSDSNAQAMSPTSRTHSPVAVMRRAVSPTRKVRDEEGMGSIQGVLNLPISTKKVVLPTLLSRSASGNGGIPAPVVKVQGENGGGIPGTPGTTRSYIPLSPSKRTMMVNLRTKTPWEEVDVDGLFEEFVDMQGAAEAWRDLKEGGELSEKEMNMTVEEWVYYNAEIAERKMREECEAMVEKFEGEGKRAVGVLEGLVVEGN